MARTVVPLLRAAGLAALAVVLAHESMFLVRYGSIDGEALAHSGHGQAWTDAVTVVLGGTALLFVASLIGLRRLGRELAGSSRPRRSTGGVAGPGLRAVVRPWLRTWAWLSLAVLAGLTVQENVEHLGAGLGLPGPGLLLGPEYPFAPAIAVAVALGVSLVATLLSWGREVLIAQIAAARRRWARSHPAAERPEAPWVERRHAAIVGHQVAGRAPPGAVAA